VEAKTRRGCRRFLPAARLQASSATTQLAGDIVLAAEGAAHHRRLYAHLFHRQAHGFSDGPAVQMRVLVWPTPTTRCPHCPVPERRFRLSIACSITAWYTLSSTRCSLRQPASHRPSATLLASRLPLSWISTLLLQRRAGSEIAGSTGSHRISDSAAAICASLPQTAAPRRRSANPAVGHR